MRGDHEGETVNGWLSQAAAMVTGGLVSALQITSTPAWWLQQVWFGAFEDSGYSLVTASLAPAARLESYSQIPGANGKKVPSVFRKSVDGLRLLRHPLGYCPAV